MRWLLTLVSVVVLLFVGVAAYDNRPFNPHNTLTVYSDGGGSIDAYQNKYGELGDSGKYLRINGVCASACTYFLRLVPSDHVCATDRARFFFHGIYSMMGFNKEAVEIWHPTTYPKFVLDLLKEKGFDGTKDVDREVYPLGMIELTREELKINAC